MKHVSEITDRAKRYRANRTRKLGTRCQCTNPRHGHGAVCGSRKNLGIGHRDGNENNGKDSNLFTVCKSCNALQAVDDKRAGRGVRTRQYNPGATNLAQYVQAAMDHVRGSHDAGGKVLHDTPKSVRREFAKEIWWRRGYRGKNPPEDIMPEFWVGKLRDSHGKLVTSKAQAKAILLSELRALGEIPPRKNPRGRAEGELEVEDKDLHGDVDYEPRSKHLPEKCANCAHFIPAATPRCQTVKSPISPNAWCERYDPRGRKGNPGADELYKKFHGAKSENHLSVMAPQLDPYGAHPEIAQFGLLVRVVVGEGVNVKGSNDSDDFEVERVSDDGWAREISFVPALAEYKRLVRNVRSQQNVDQLKAWLRKQGTPDLAGAPDGDQLYIVGGNQDVSKYLGALGADASKERIDLGFLLMLEYFTQKRFDRMQPIDYYHRLGESTHEYPRLTYWRDIPLLEVVGGAYKVTPRGIVN